MNAILYRLYSRGNGRWRKLILRLVKRLEGGEIYSTTLRRILRDYHKVDIGMYSVGGCFDPNLFDKYTTVGRYCSIARTARVMNRNHPLQHKSIHPFFFNPFLKQCETDEIEYKPLVIENDVWIGHNAIILPNVCRIRTGAVVGAGAVVNKDVPPYAVVVGNPARVVRFRFSQKVVDELLASRWWDQSIEEIKPSIAQFMKAFDGDGEGE